MSLGASIALFEMLFYFRQVISEEVILEIAHRAQQQLLNMQAKLTQAEKHCLM